MMAYEMREMAHGMKSLEDDGLMPDFLLWNRLTSGTELPPDAQVKHMK
jgi:hypothetical protein